MLNKNKFFKASTTKKLVHSHRGWLVCSAALLAALGLGSAEQMTTHADTTSTNQQDAARQTSNKPQSINITKPDQASITANSNRTNSIDAQQGYGDVDNDQNEMKADLNSHNNKSVSPFLVKTKQSNEASNSPQDNTEYTNQDTQSSILDDKTKVLTYRDDNIHIPNQGQKSATLPKSKANVTDRIQQQADQLHSRLMSAQITSKARQNEQHKPHLLGAVQPGYYLADPLPKQSDLVCDSIVSTISGNKGVATPYSQPDTKASNDVNLYRYIPYTSGPDDITVYNQYAGNYTFYSTGLVYLDKTGQLWGQYYNEASPDSSSSISLYWYKLKASLSAYKTDKVQYDSNYNNSGIGTISSIKPDDMNTWPGKLYNGNGVFSFKASDLINAGEGDGDERVVNYQAPFNQDVHVIDAFNYSNDDYENSINDTIHFYYDKMYSGFDGDKWIHVDKISDATKPNNYGHFMPFSMNPIDNSNSFDSDGWYCLGVPSDEILAPTNQANAIGPFKNTRPSQLSSTPWSNPSAWQPANPAAVAASQKTDTIDYQYDGQTKGSHQFTGNPSQSVTVSGSNDPGIPSDFHLAGNSTFRYDGGTHDVAIAPNVVNADVNVTYTNQNGANVGSHSFTVTAAPGSTYNVEPQVNQFLPNGYHLNSFNAINIHMPNQLGSTLHLDLGMDMTTGSVQPRKASPVIFALRNQNGNIIGYTKPIRSLGHVGQTINAEPSISRHMPLGYSLASDKPIDVTLTGQGIITVTI